MNQGGLRRDGEIKTVRKSRQLGSMHILETNRKQLRRFRNPSHDPLRLVDEPLRNRWVSPMIPERRLFQIAVKQRML